MGSNFFASIKFKLGCSIVGTINLRPVGPNFDQLPTYLIYVHTSRILKSKKHPLMYLFCNCNRYLYYSCYSLPYELKVKCLMDNSQR